MVDDVDHSAARLLMLLAQFGSAVSSAMRAASGEDELVGNAPILVLSSLDLSGPQRPKDLAALTTLSTGGLSKLLDRMEELGTIQREHGSIPEDRRAVLVSLTERGDALLRLLAGELAKRVPEARRLVDEIFQVLEAQPPT